MFGFQIHDSQGNVIDPKIVMDRWNRGVYHREAMAKAQNAQARLHHEQGEVRHGKNFKRVLSIDPTIYHHWTEREGEGVWMEPEFQRDMLRDNPELAPKIAKTTNRVGYTGACRMIDSPPAPAGCLIRAGKYTKVSA